MPEFWASTRDTRRLLQCGNPQQQPPLSCPRATRTEPCTVDLSPFQVIIFLPVSRFMSFLLKSVDINNIA